ncbi:bifunctional UDP-3-O-[3-hydroxymyristoyl] N-acetylglucosamine deacetylase/3-hydroxyacyl-ACP dehydratase [bacterium]|nr:bifunctional UDP-3-O-[3-hydroxymyristoyl] N-acetylglucosamine deacetylase/3-hydroxyacyl-ACP dehydratase [bacterium]
MGQQKTIEREISYSGIGLHTGVKTKINFKPAPPDSGIKFIRIDLPGQPVIEANISNVVGIKRGTTIGKDGVEIHTVEHLMAAFYGLGIDNLVIEINSKELPVADGSSLPFLEVLKKSGVKTQNVPKKYFVVNQPIEFSKGDKQLVVLPYDGFKVSCTIDYNHPVLKTQFFSSVITEENFEREVASSRTFCFDYEIEELKKQGLARGGTLENAVVVGEKGIHNKNLRFTDEFVRHKVLDLIGDLYLLGKCLKGHVIAIKCGHPSNIALAKKINEFMTSSPVSKEVSSSSILEMPKKQIPEGKIFDINEIQKLIPHRYPFLFVDKIIIVEEKKAVGFKNVTINENFFNGHFPGHPIMPGVLIVESMAQASCVLFLSRPDLRNKIAYFMAIREAKFRRPVFPGDQLRLEVEILKARARGGIVKGLAYIGDKLAAEAEFMFSLVDK